MRLYYSPSLSLLLHSYMHQIHIYLTIRQQSRVVYEVIFNEGKARVDNATEIVLV